MTNNSPTLPSFADVVFSIKTFIAAMLALLVALCFDLQNPFWAVTTVYIVSTPLSGASTSKAVYRLLGTFLGGVMTVILVPNLVNSPELLTAAISLWIGLCLAISLLDRTPRSYVFLLAGYTTALTGFPIVATPELAFTNAAARVLEIAVGILSAAIISRILFPRHVGPVLSARIDAWLSESSGLIVRMVQGRQQEPDATISIRRLAADAVDIRGFTAHAVYDTSGYREVATYAKTLQRRMVTLLPTISALGKSWTMLSTGPDSIPHPSIAAVADDISSWISSGEALSAGARVALSVSMQGANDAIDSMPLGERALGRYTLARTRDLLQVWNDCILLRQDISSGSRHQLGWRRFGPSSKDWPMHRDYGSAVHSAISTILVTVLATTFWIATGWAQGGTAAMMAAVLCCIFSTMDDPTPAMRGFLFSGALSVVAAFCLEFGVLPALDGYIPLVAALGLFLIPSGVLMARPRTFISGLAFSMMLPTLLSLQDRLDLNFETFVNGNLAILAGFGMAWGTTALVRTVSAEFSARRLLRAGWTDIAQSARGPNDSDLSHRMIDRLGLIAPRLAALPERSDILQNEMLHDLRDAFNVSELQHHAVHLSKSGKAAIVNVLDLISADYKAKLKHANSKPDEMLLIAIDIASAELSKSQGASIANELCSLALTGLRYNIFPAADEQPWTSIQQRAVPKNIDQAA